MRFWRFCHFSLPARISHEVLITYVETLLRTWPKVTGPFMPASTQAMWRKTEGFKICFPRTVWKVYLLSNIWRQHFLWATLVIHLYSSSLRNTAASPKEATVLCSSTLGWDETSSFLSLGRLTLETLVSTLFQRIPYQNSVLAATTPGLCSHHLLWGHVGEQDGAVSCEDWQVAHHIPHQQVVLLAAWSISRQHSYTKEMDQRLSCQIDPPPRPPVSPSPNCTQNKHLHLRSSWGIFFLAFLMKSLSCWGWRSPSVKSVTRTSHFIFP